MAPSPLRLKQAVQALRQGGVIACPTEAVWGLSCDPQSFPAVSRLLALKGRDPGKGLILVASKEADFEPLLAGLEPQQRAVLTDSWPGPATWLVPHCGRVPAWIHGDHAAVALRVSDHPVLSALCAAWGGPLVSTSANPAGSRPPRFAFQVRRYFSDQLDALLPGSVGELGRPTRIRDLASGRVIRD